MPRKSAESNASVEKRVTRKSTDSKKPDNRKTEKEPKSNNTPTARSHSPRQRKVKSYAEEDVDEIDDMDEEPVVKAKGKRGRKSQGKQKKKNNEDENDEEIEAKVKTEVSKSRSTRNRSTARQPAEESASRRKSERGAARVAELKIAEASRAEVESEETEDFEEMESEPVKGKGGVKRKANNGNGESALKKAKTEISATNLSSNDIVLKEDNDILEKPVNDANGSEQSAANICNKEIENKDSKIVTEEDQHNENTESKSTDAAKQIDNSTEYEESKSDHADDFVIVDKHDVPAADSEEVKEAIQSVEKHVYKESDNALVIDEAIDLDKTQQPPDDSHSHNVGSDNVVSGNDNPSLEHQSANNPQEKLNENSNKNDYMFTRQFICNPHGCKVDDQSKKFTFVSYNILADCHAQRSPYGWTTKEYLSQTFRHDLLLKELNNLDSDIVCFQEVGTAYYDILLSAMKSKGYDGVFIKRSAEYFDEGEATFYRTSKFTLESGHPCKLVDIIEEEVNRVVGLEEWAREALIKALSDPGAVLITQLRSQNGAIVTVANIHLIWTEKGKPDVHCIQVAQIIRHLLSIAGGTDSAYILCGDFNNTPSSPVYQLTRDGYPNDSSLAQLQAFKNISGPEGETSLVNVWWDGFKHTANSLNSAYFTCLGKEPISSKYPHDGSIHSLDVIWYSSKSLELEGVLSPVDEQTIFTGIPNQQYPSDHVSLKATFSFK